MGRELANAAKGAQREGLKRIQYKKNRKRKKVQKNTKSAKTSENGKPTYLDDDDL